jgi:hypothetical protein
MDVTILNSFDGFYNYFNPSSLNGTTLLRQESKYEDRILVSDTISSKNEIILQHHTTDEYLVSYEDVRFINDREISVCVCNRKLEDLSQIKHVRFKKYNLDTKEFTHFNTQNSCFEKHWQFTGNRIIYHVDPYTIMNHDESTVFTKVLNWARWTNLYGNPRLSTNVFNVAGKNYLLFHSSVQTGQLCYKYYTGLLYLDPTLNPIGYYPNPIFEADREYSDNTLLNDLWDWRKTELRDTVKYEVIFPMNVIVGDTIDVYAGLNDCSAVTIRIPVDEFTEKISNELIMLV